MVDQKITALTALTTPADTDVLVIVDDPGGTPVTKKITVADLLALAGGGAWSIIEEKTPTSGNTVTFNTGLSGYSMFKLIIQIQGDGTGDEIYVRINGSTTAGDYEWVGTRFEGTGGTAAVAEQASTDAEGIKCMDEFYLNAANAKIAFGTIEIFKLGSSLKTCVQSNFTASDDTSTAKAHRALYGGTYNSTTAISSIIVDSNGKTWESPSKLILLGMS